MREGDRIEVRRPAGGLVSALDPTMRRAHGVWVAWGSGSGDRDSADSEGRVHVPPEDPSYVLRRVWLSDADVDGYYNGFANSALWPVCHMLVQHFAYRTEHWERYVAVNHRFADAAADEARRLPGRPMVWIQDYHLALAAERLRLAHPSIFIHQFWHIPFPPADLLRLIPVGVHDALLRGLLGNDLLEFHTTRYARNFLSCVSQFVPDATVDVENSQVHRAGRTTHVGTFPISIDAAAFEARATSPTAVERTRSLRERHASPARQLGVSVDRVDYTKGIPERLRALQLLWAESPEMRGRFTMLIVATPSRTELQPYRALAEEMLAAVADINVRFGTVDWTPILLIHENADADVLAAIYRAADLCLVSSLQDGMNLVAKEFVACQVEERGVLVLSRFAGAAEEFEGAVLINPFNVDGFAAGIRTALEMQPDERRRRMRAMREWLKGATIFDWLDAILGRAAELMRAPRASA